VYPSFFDDILVYSKSLDQHAVDLQEVVSLLRKDQWLIKESKCAFGQWSIAYLGYVISPAGVATDPSQIAEVRKWEQPQNVKELRQFFGLIGYYRKLVGSCARCCAVSLYLCFFFPCIVCTFG
jgi:hypothetical protein